MSGQKESLCCGQLHPVHKLTEVSLLILLMQGVTHGYAMIENLKKLDLGLQDLNTSTLYRTLRRMESDGSIRSQWAAGGPGPKRRVYQITEQGADHLKQWIEMLQIRRSRITAVVDAYEQLQKQSSQIEQPVH